MAIPEPLPPIDAVPLLPIVEARLLDLLRSLAPEDWDRATLAPRWCVREVACHLELGDLASQQVAELARAEAG